MAYEIEISHNANMIVHQFTSAADGLDSLQPPKTTVNMEGCNNYIQACEELLKMIKVYHSLVAKDGAEIEKFIAEMRQLDSNA